jgi:hypothetical protein
MMVDLVLDIMLAIAKGEMMLYQILITNSVETIILIHTAQDIILAIELDMLCRTSYIIDR